MDAETPQNKPHVKGFYTKRARTNNCKCRSAIASRLINLPFIANLTSTCTDQPYTDQALLAYKQTCL